MKITSLRIRTLKNTGNKMVGVATITLDNMIAIHDIKILKNDDCLFLAMPSKTIKPGTFKDYVHPINAMVREALERIIFSFYKVCNEKNYCCAQFNVLPGFSESLIEQNYSDFNLASNEAYKIISTNEDNSQSGNEEKYETVDKKKTSNAFLDWLNN